MEIRQKKLTATFIINGVFLVAFNIILMLITGFLTLDSEANLNSRVGAYLLSFLIPLVIALKTPMMTGTERLLKFGSGFIVYIILALIMIPLQGALFTGLIPCLVISLAVLFYGKEIIKSAGL
jgi:hypothetical protein